MDRSFAENFASDWIDAWNKHDIERILAYYAHNFEFSSPILAKVSAASGGRLIGREAARLYWAKGLAARTDLHFELVQVLAGVGSVVIYYKGLGGKFCAEFFEFGPDGKVVRSHAHGALQQDG